MYRTTKDFDSGDLFTGSRICVTCNKRQYMENFHWTAGQYQVAEHFGVSQTTVHKYIKESKGKND